MRMWNVPPKVLCRQHLLGEHLEMHMFAGAIKKGTSLQGFITGGLVMTGRIKERHDELVAEMVRRGMNHKSPMNKQPRIAEAGYVSYQASIAELSKRCPACRKNIVAYQYDKMG